MGRYKENPRYCVLSVRMSDGELEEIESLAMDSNVTKSDYVRAIIRSVLDWKKA